MARQRGSLWRNADFLRLWAGQTASLFGSQITTLALPILAALVLDATPTQMSLLVAAATLPDLLIGLVAGVWVDRLRRRPLLIAADLGRAALLLLIPLAAAAGLLRLWILVPLAFALGLLTTIFGIAYSSYLPALVSREELVEANGRLQTSGAVAGVAGPGLAGLLIQILTAPFAVLADAASFLLSAALLARIGAAEPSPPGARAGLRHEIGEGLRAVAGSPVLRALAGSSGTFNFFDSFLTAVYVLYLTRTLGLGPAAVGGVFAIGGIGGVLGALAAAALARRLGLGRALLAAMLLAGIGELGIALAGGPPLVAVVLVGLAEAVVQGSAAVFGINGVSLRQSATPDRLLGRVNATLRTVQTGLVPIGALLGGAVAERLGLRAAVATAGVGVLLATLWIVGSPVPALRDASAEVARAG